MKKYMVPLLLVLAVLPAFGAAKRVTLVVSDTGFTGAPTSYTVPSGKVLIIDAVKVGVASGGSPTSSRIRLSIDYDNSTLSSNENITVNEQYTTAWNFLTHKIYIKSGDSFGAPLDFSYTTLRIMGTLIDEADLFAANLPVKLENTRVEGNKLMADAKVQSARPHRITVQSSLDLSGFAADVTAEVTSTTTTGTSVVSVDRGATGKKFLRVSAKAVPRR